MRKILCYVLPLVGWMGIIFWFSHQPKDESIQYSQIAIWLLELLGIDLNDFTMGNASFVVRKLAHITEYFILFCLTWRFNKKITKYSIVCVVLFCVLYAITDEFHQSFVLGRVSCWQDVCVDSIGVGLGFLLLGRKNFVIKW